VVDLTELLKRSLRGKDAVSPRRAAKATAKKAGATKTTPADENGAWSAPVV
jgi:hypothetical protein